MPDSPDGGVLPFAPRERVSHYYGVGAYLRLLDDARRADAGFASECLHSRTCRATRRSPVSELAGARRAGQPPPRDPGTSWDFEDIRDHYLQTLYDVVPDRLRREDPARYSSCRAR